MNFMLIALAFTKQVIYGIGTYCFLRIFHYPKKIRDVFEFDRPVGTIRLIWFIWFVFGTWFRYTTDTPLLGAWGYWFGMKY